MGLTRRHLFGILTGAAAYAVAPEPLRRYFIIGQPERRFAPQPVWYASTTDSAGNTWRLFSLGHGAECPIRVLSASDPRIFVERVPALDADHPGVVPPLWLSERPTFGRYAVYAEAPDRSILNMSLEFPDRLRGA